MKITLASILLISAAAFTATADNEPLTGKWRVHNSVAGNESDQACTITQKGSEITGECTSERGTVKITGKVEDKTVSWMYKSEYEGNPLTVKYQGSLDESGKIKGAINVEEYGAEGDFTATPSK